MRITIAEIAEPSKGEAKNTRSSSAQYWGENLLSMWDWRLHKKSYRQIHKLNFFVANDGYCKKKNRRRLEVIPEQHKEDLKPWRRRRQGRATPSKEGFIFHLQISQLSWSFYSSIGLKSCSTPAITSNGKFEKLVIVARVLQNIKYTISSRCCFAEHG